MMPALYFFALAALNDKLVNSFFLLKGVPNEFRRSVTSFKFFYCDKMF